MKPIDFLRDTVDLVKQIETRFLELGSRLYRIKEERLWESTYDSYQEFLEAAHINPGHASILVSIHRKFIVEGQKTKEELAGIGYSNLYEAIPLIDRDGVEVAVVKAETLTRSEIKEEVREQKHGVHEHVAGTERWGVCECGKFIRVD